MTFLQSFPGLEVAVLKFHRFSMTIFGVVYYRSSKNCIRTSPNVVEHACRWFLGNSVIQFYLSLVLSQVWNFVFTFGPLMHDAFVHGLGFGCLLKCSNDSRSRAGTDKGLFIFHFGLT